MKSILFPILIFALLILLNGCYEEDEDPLGNLPPDCSEVPEITIEELDPPNPGESDGRIILTEINGVEYSLNDTLYQELNQFSGLPKGEYTVYIRTVEGCKNDLRVNLDERQVVQWQIPSGADTAELPFTIYYQTWNWQNIFGEKGVRLYRNDSLIKTQYLNIDTMKFSALPDGIANWKLALWDIVDREEKSSHTISFTILNPVFKLIVNSGVGSGLYKEGEVVDISGSKPLLGLKFSHWSGDSIYIQDISERITQFNMPAQSVEITSNYCIQDTVYFNSEVKPIIDTKCATPSCHDAGSANTDLSDFNTIRQYSKEIRDFIVTDFMPPPPDILSVDEKNAIIKWVNQGALNN